MAQSLSKIYIHIIFHTKTTSPTIYPEDLPNLHSYIGQVINITKCTNVWVGGVEDHVHALCILSREVTIAHLVEEIKRNSSRWIKTLSPKYNTFAWQGGYAAFSVSQSNVNSVLSYIKNQTEHHKRMSFKDEYRSFLKLYNITYEEDYVFVD